MDLDRGKLARIDRKLLAGLGQDETFQMVRVPVTAAKWATWKRYCDAAGLSMGRAIMLLIECELLSVVGESVTDEVPAMSDRVQEQLETRETLVGERERQVEAKEERLRRWTERMHIRETELEAREQRAELDSKLGAWAPVANPKVGRNDQCPCGSGSKYKWCHGR